MNIAELADSIAEAAPLESATSTVPGRVLSIDADMVAYQCGGNEETTLAQSRDRVHTLVQRFKQWVGADKVMLHITGDGSTKGDRYLAAIRKPYQGNRKSGHKPHNTDALRKWMADGQLDYPVKVWLDREADDGICYMAHNLTDHWIATRDKDLRMIPGGHLNWETGEMTRFERGTYDHQAWGKQFGLKWFWLQMLQGDTADNIPNVARLFGPAKAEKALADTVSTIEAFDIVADLYLQYHGDAWAEAFASQAAMLWMRTDKAGDLLDFMRYMPGVGHPLTNQLFDACHHLAERVEDMKKEAACLSD